MVTTNISICTTINDKVVILESTLTCPKCGHTTKELMPTDSCELYFECTRCKRAIRRKNGDCCVYCSYGSAKCPSKQIAENCC